MADDTTIKMLALMDARRKARMRGSKPMAIEQAMQQANMPPEDNAPIYQDPRAEEYAQIAAEQGVQPVSVENERMAQPGPYEWDPDANFLQRLAQGAKQVGGYVSDQASAYYQNNWAPIVNGIKSVNEGGNFYDSPEEQRKRAYKNDERKVMLRRIKKKK